MRERAVVASVRRRPPAAACRPRWRRPHRGL